MSDIIRNIKGTKDIPRDSSIGIKAILLVEDNKDEWKFNKLKSIMLNNSNINKFQTSEFEIGICNKLSGINLEYLTHIIVTDLSNQELKIQFIGRGQRLNRKFNLQVLEIQ